VQFSDGSAAIFEAEELEKLRPKPKQVLATAAPATPIVMEPAVTVASTAETDKTLLVSSAVA